MAKWWSILFAVTMVACALLFVVSPLVGWWLPEGVSSHYWSVDRLFYVIFWITAFFFVLTEALLCVFMYKYSGARAAGDVQSRGWLAKLPGPITNMLKDPHKVEMAWTIVPAVILLYIAFAQVGAWANVKYQSRLREIEEQTTPLQLDVTARQWEWRVRYPSSARFEQWMTKKDARTQNDYKSFPKLEQIDDVKLVNEVHVWKGHPALVQLSTRDVIHSFNLPHLRVKQDSLPGKQIPLWFTPTKHNTARTAEGTWMDEYNPDTKQFGDAKQRWDLSCAELCGWGHWRMVGRLYVHETQADFLAWLKETEAKAHATQEK